MSDQGSQRYVTCIRCVHTMTWLEHESLRFAMPCPECGTPNQFGPEVYVPEFQGYTMAEVQQKRRAKARNG